METPSGNLSQIMRHINGAYTSYFKIIGERFNIGESAVSQASRRITAKMESDKSLKTLVKKLDKALNVPRG